MFFFNEEGKNVKNDTIRLIKGELNCTNYYVYVKVRNNMENKFQEADAYNFFLSFLSQIFAIS